MTMIYGGSLKQDGHMMMFCHILKKLKIFKVMEMMSAHGFDGLLNVKKSPEQMIQWMFF